MNTNLGAVFHSADSQRCCPLVGSDWVGTKLREETGDVLLAS